MNVGVGRSLSFCDLFAPADGSSRSTKQNGPLTAEGPGTMPDRKHSYADETDVVCKQTKTGDLIHEEDTQTMEDSEQRSVEISEPRPITMKHPVNIQNGIYAAERLSCSFDITHSLNFILCGEILLSEFFPAAQLTRGLFF